MEDSKFQFIMLHNSPSWPTKTIKLNGQGLTIKEVVSEGGRAEWTQAKIVLSPNYLMQLSGSQKSANSIYFHLASTFKNAYIG